MTYKEWMWFKSSFEIFSLKFILFNKKIKQKEIFIYIKKIIIIIIIIFKKNHKFLNQGSHTEC